MSDAWEPPLPGAPREPAGPDLPDEGLGADPDARAAREADLREAKRALVRAARVLLGAIVLALLAGLAWTWLRADG